MVPRVILRLLGLVLDVGLIKNRAVWRISSNCSAEERIERWMLGRQRTVLTLVAGDGACYTGYWFHHNLPTSVCFLPVAVLPKICVLLSTLCDGEFSVSAWLVMEI